MKKPEFLPAFSFSLLLKEQPFYNFQAISDDLNLKSIAYCTIFVNSKYLALNIDNFIYYCAQIGQFWLSFMCKIWYN